MFWKKKSDEVEEVKQVDNSEKVEEIKKLTEEELIASDNEDLQNFDNKIKKIGEFIVYNINNEMERTIAIKTTIKNDTNIRIRKLSKEDCEWEIGRIQEGYIWAVSCGGIMLAFYDFNNAQKYLYKYLELLSS